MIVRLKAAAKLCGIDRTTLYRWTIDDPRVAACVFRPGWYIVERLAERGLCQPVSAIIEQKAREEDASKAGVA